MHGERIFAITKLTKVWSACTSREMFEECYMIIIHVCLVVLPHSKNMGVKNCSKPRKSIITHPWGHIKWKESFSWKFGFRFFYVAMLCVLLPHLENWASRTWEYVVKNGPMVIIVERTSPKNLDFFRISNPKLMGSPTGSKSRDPHLTSPRSNQPLENPYHPTPRCWFHGTSKTLQMWEDRWECLSAGILFFGGNHPKTGWTPKHSSGRWIC